MSLRRAIQQHRGPVQALITEGRGILETYCGFIRGLREEERRLDDEKQETDIKIVETYRQACNQINQIYQQLTEERDSLLSEVETNHRQSKGIVQSQRYAVLTDVAELSSACDGAEQDMTREDKELLNRESKLDEVVGKFRDKTVPSLIPTQPVVFEPTVKFTCTCTIRKETDAGAATNGAAAMAMGHHHSNQSRTVAPKERLTFGGKGSGPGQFCILYGVAVSEGGEIFVTDVQNVRIQVFTLQGTFVRQFPTAVPDESVMLPYDVALDGEGNLWAVGCTLNGSGEFAVQYDRQGRVLRKFELNKIKQHRGVAVDTRRNHVLITGITGDDTDSDNEDDENDGEGNILVSDYGNNGVYVSNEDGEFLFQFGGKGSGEGQLKDPRGICTDRAGNIIVADSDNGRVEMFDKTGRFIKHIITDMTCPIAVAIAPQGQLVVTDIEDNTVTIHASR
uniref:B-box C-terminal domain-containing protein n=1 Tax=Branchiostoma floridae TaxID=7739 RepID=C3ZG91_BRAFL|eukprot:XP_002592401.1 hypothetical protein BRAFLDRAFT_67266 [Branchiostoma floridae]